ALATLSAPPPAELLKPAAIVLLPVLLPARVSVRGVTPKLRVSAPLSVGLALSVTVLVVRLIALMVVSGAMFVPVTLMPTTRSFTLANRTLLLVALSVVERAGASAATTLPALLNVIAPLPEASSDPPGAATVKRRSVPAVPPVYWSVPPVRTRFPAAFDEAPSALFAPPLGMLPTARVPPAADVGPV